MYKKLSECKEKIDVLNRLDILRKNMVEFSKGEFKGADNKAIYVDWNWINFFEVRLDNDKENNIRIEIWVADVKHQWNDLSKVSSMEFVSRQEVTYLIKGLNINADHYIGAYIKLGDPYGNTLKVADYDIEYVKANFNKNYYKNFYKTIGGQWKKDIEKNDFVRNGLLLTEEIKKLPIINKDDIINYVKNETRNVINLSLGTTVNLSVPINELAEKDIKFDYEKGIDELAKPLSDYVIEYKEKIER